VRIEDSGQSGTGNGDRGEVAAATRRGAKPIALIPC
jgi:hypothetical protein